MRTKLLLDIIDELGHSYNLLRTIGFGWIDWGEIPGEEPTPPDGGSPWIPPIPPPPGPWLPPAPSYPGAPGYGEPSPPPPAPPPPPGPPAPPPPPPPPPPGPPGGPPGGPAGGPGPPGSGVFGFGAGAYGAGGLGGPGGGGGGIDCCANIDLPGELVKIGYDTLEINCGESQDLTVSGYNPGCQPTCYSFVLASGSGTLVDNGDYTATYTAPDGSAAVETPAVINLLCLGGLADSIEIALTFCSVTIGYDTLAMNCTDIQGLTVEGYGELCSPSIFSWALEPDSGTLVDNENFTATYTAPTGGGNCESPVTIILSCLEDVVDSIEITINPCPATGSIGYTSRQMSINGTQTLTAVAGAAGCGTPTYDWAITAGSGTLSAATGASVVYTAPATNANCVNNPTITLSCGGVLLDTLKIAVNNPAQTGTALAWCCNCDLTWCNNNNLHRCYWFYKCNGVPAGTGTSCGSTCTTMSCCTGYTSGDIYSDWHHCDTTGLGPGLNDNRTQAQKDAGCCPEQLL